MGSLDQEKIKSHYNIRPNKSIEERNNTKNINIRNANNSVKALLINKYVKDGDAVLDLGIGKGGDFKKYNAAKISELYGVDIANRSILDAIERAREGMFNFNIILKTKNAFGPDLNLKRVFDVVSSQFAFHYSYVDENTLDNAIKNIDRHLKYNGYLIITTLDKNEILRRKNTGNLENSYYKIAFKDGESDKLYGNAYYYTLVDSVENCVEYLVDINELTRKMDEVGLDLVESTGFREFYERESKMNSDIRRLRLNNEESSVFDLHIVVVFKKRKWKPVN